MIPRFRTQGPASSVVECSLLFVHKGTVVQISPRTTFQTQSFLQNFRTNVWRKIQLSDGLHQPHATSIEKLLRHLYWAKGKVAWTNLLYDGRQMTSYTLLRNSTTNSSNFSPIISIHNVTYGGPRSIDWMGQVIMEGPNRLGQAGKEIGQQDRTWYIPWNRGCPV